MRRKFAGIMRKRARYLMRKIHGEDAIRGKHIDHIDHNPLNNNIENLRIRDASENCSDNTRKYKRIIEKIGKLSKKRCWKGYEPVSGKDPYSNGSCKKI